MTRYLVAFEYEGSNFFGSQKQPDKITVQGELERAICTLTKDKSIKITMAGRLDRGVNAEYHTAHFDTAFEFEQGKFIYSINALLPSGLAVFDVKEVKERFHSQKQAKFRHYRYTIRNSNVKPVFDKNVLWIRKPLNYKVMQDALKYIIGIHDFSAFKSTSDNPATVCEIYSALIAKRPINERIDGCYLDIDIVGNRFLYNMVRAITGTLLMIENEKLPPQKMEEILKSKQRAQAGRNVEPQGLCLVRTGYCDPEIYINNLKGKANINENI